MDNYQIFISYRRDGGEDLAGRLADRLTILGYKVFYDVESMRSGTFNTQILDAIAQCNDFLLILPPYGLDRCVNSDDWVRQELAFALEQGKNIIPVMMRGFEFPKVLPSNIDKIRYMEGVTASNEYFDAVIEKIKRLLVSFLRLTDVKKDKNCSDTEINDNLGTSKDKFNNLLQELHSITTYFRNVTRSADVVQINKYTIEMQNLVQEVYYIYERTKYSNPEVSQSASWIVATFNKFVTWYSKFINSSDRTSNEAQEYARKAQEWFSNFIDNIVQTLES